jgi:hypothetical protein
MSVTVKTRVAIGSGLLLLLVSAAVNVLQAQRIHFLLETTNAGVSGIGKPATPVDGFTLGDRSVTVRFDERRPTVIYYFSPTCGWCERNWANIKALSAAADGRYRLIAVTADRGVSDYARRHDLELEVIEGISENVRAAYAFYGTPHTVVVDAEGVVTHEWRGAFNPRIERQIEELFGIKLPGLAPPVPTDRN